MLARLVTVAALALGLVIVAAMLALPAAPATPVDATLAAVPGSGVTHPVTAVLLAFRAYDTLLEMAVVLLAVRIAAPDGPVAAPPPGAHDPMTAALLRVLVPLIVVVAAVVMWTGTRQPGGAFAAGALVAGAGVALRLGGQWTAPLIDLRWRVLQALGLGGFLVLGAIPLLAGRPWLSAPGDWAGTVLLAIEAALTVSIAAGLVSLFASSPPGAAGPRR
jgi:multisubunit Na+/H+ antiporter MnhB subunit